MAGDHGKSGYVNFCSVEGETTTSKSEYYSYNAENGVDSYEDSASPGNSATDEDYSKGFQLWMVGTAVSVGMALTAIHMGQKKDGVDIVNDDSAVGKNVTGSVNRRLSAVSAFADGVMGSTTGAKQVELSQYQPSDQQLSASPSPPSYPTSSYV